MAGKEILIFCMVTFCLATTVSCSLKIAAFNIKTFGVSKMSEPEVVPILVDICVRYDVIVIQEIRDKSGEAIQELLDLVNGVSNNAYAMIISDRLGRSSYKEQYAFFYRIDKLSVTDSYHYDDGVDDYTDEFAREPFVVRFLSSFTAVEDFAIAAIHVDPDIAVQEIDSLTDVYDDIVKRWRLQDVLIAGDYNADCSYVKSSEWPYIRLRTDSRFTWLIEDDDDTTVSSTHCAYDRLVVAGAALTSAVDPTSSAVFYYDTYYGLDYELAYDVSDHFPVEMVLN
ncbi:deoxyribonuclease-1-like [Glandiceps talaboti]